MDITEDEAYYWMYSRILDWGYFDHPPMIALMIFLGRQLFEGELGVRVLTVLLQLGLLVVLWKLVSREQPANKNILLFFGIPASIIMFQVYGFIATPDAPLLFFTGLLLLAYYHFLQRETIWNILWLAISMAGLMYSKYHGALIIFFLVLSNLSLLLRPKFWLACLLGVVLFIPHLYWQYVNSFPTLEFHLVSRSRPFAWKNVLNFFPNQFLSFNPVFLLLALFVMFRYKPLDKMERAAYFISFGFLVFFFFTSFRGHVEPHWTIAASIPMFFILYRRCVVNERLRKTVTYVLFPTILLLLFVRLALMFEWFPQMVKLQAQDEWCQRLYEIARNKPVIFQNTFQKPSLYAFHTGRPTTALNGVTYKKSQYDLWNIDQAFVGKEVILVTGIKGDSAQPFDFKFGADAYLHTIPDFFDVQKLEVTYSFPESHQLTVNDSMVLEIEIFNPYPYRINFTDNELPVRVAPALVRYGRQFTFIPADFTEPVLSMKSDERIKNKVKFIVPQVDPGQYQFGITLQAGIIEGAFNSRFIKVEVLPD